MAQPPLNIRQVGVATTSGPSNTTTAASTTTTPEASEEVKQVERTATAPELNFDKADNWAQNNAAAQQTLNYYTERVLDENGQFNYEALTDEQKAEFDEAQNTFDRTTWRLGEYDKFRAQDPANQLPSAQELTAQMLENSSQFLPEIDVPEVEKKGNQYLKSSAARMGDAPEADLTEVKNTSTANMVEEFEAPEVDAAKSTEGVRRITGNMEAAQGDVSKKVGAVTMNPKNLRQLKLNAAQTGQVSIEDVEALGMTEDQFVEAVKFAGYTDVEAAISDDFSQLEAIVGSVGANEIVDKDELFQGKEAVVAEAATAAGLDPAAVVPKIVGKLSEEAFAKAAQGDVDSQMTMQGQLSSLMSEFNDGKTPAWAAGAMRAANAAMAARGLGGSSMASAAIVQAAMESAMPIAQNDAAVFERMAVTNLNNQQQVALANAAAQQNIELQNLSFEQQRAISNSANAFALQSQNLSNQQATVIANAQFKAGLQGQMLGIEAQVSLSNAARYAEMNNINLSNQQQAALQKSSENLQVNLANLSNRQQSAIAKAQIEAAQKGQELTNEQQANVLNAARIGEIANLNFTAEQQKAIEQARLTSTIDIANLDARNAKVLADAAALTQIDTTNLNNRQMSQVENARNFLQMDLANLSNEQQATIFKTQSRVNALMSDKAAENAMRQFNAASEVQVDQFFADMQYNLRKFNTDQVNAMRKFNAGEANALEQFNTATESTWQQFETGNKLAIKQANAKWNQDMTSQEFAATAEAYLTQYKTAAGMTSMAYESVMQRDRDLLAFTFQATESALERGLRLALQTMDDKTRKELLEMDQDFQDEQGKGSFIGGIVASAVDVASDAISSLWN